jgi:hypothetical protein
MQEYDNYHVVYIDDKSEDGTGNSVENYLKFIEGKFKLEGVKEKF